MTVAEEIGATVGAWNALVRRARIGRDRKVAALILSSYADADGTGIRCGVARLAVDMECSYRTARRYLGWLRKVGLIEVMQPGNRRRKRSDVYRLILHPDILETLDIPNPDAYAKLADAIRAADQRTPKKSAEPAQPEDTLGDPQSAVDDQISEDMMADPLTIDQGSNEAQPEDTLGDPPPPIRTSPLTTTSPADDERVRTDLTVARASEPAEDPDPSLPKLAKPTHCAHRLRIRYRPDGQPSCALCRRFGETLPDDHLADVIPLHRDAS